MSLALARRWPMAWMPGVLLVLASLMPSSAIAQVAAAPLIASSVDGYTAPLLAGCRTYSVGYRLNLPSTTTAFDVEITITDPSGEDETFTAESAGSVGVFVCQGADGVGRYDVTISGTYQDVSQGYGPVGGSGAFWLRKAKTRVHLEASNTRPRFNQPVKLSVVAAVEGRYGYAPLKYATVQMQIRVRGSWVPARKLNFFTSGNGRDYAWYRWNVRPPLTFRVVVPAGDGHTRSVSRPVTVDAR